MGRLLTVIVHCQPQAKKIKVDGIPIRLKKDKEIETSPWPSTEGEFSHLG